jgi:cytochrome c oxidase assembly protein Cox11
MAFFIAKNLPPTRSSGGQFNVTPEQTAPISQDPVLLLQRTAAGPHQEVRMPVIYYVDPAMLDDANAKDIGEITLSYTFHRRRHRARAGGEVGLALSREGAESHWTAPFAGDKGRRLPGSCPDAMRNLGDDHHGRR